MHGEPAYPPDFTHFGYVDPDAPKGGSLVMAAIGSFDSLNPYIVRGTPAAGRRAGVRDPDHAVQRRGRSPSTACSPRPSRCRRTAPGSRSSCGREARWHDGQPVTVDDVIFSFDILKTKGAPFYRAYYANVVEAVADGERG